MNTSRKTRRLPFGWIALILFIALLFATNPSESQFNSYLKNKIQEQAEGDDTPGGALKKLFAGPAASIAGLGTVRKDYYLFSTYKFSLLGEEHLYLGIFDHFLRID